VRANESFAIAEAATTKYCVMHAPSCDPPPSGHVTIDAAYVDRPGPSSESSCRKPVRGSPIFLIGRSATRSSSGRAGGDANANMGPAQAFPQPGGRRVKPLHGDAPAVAVAALNADQAAWKSAFACSSVATRLLVRTRNRAGPMTVIDQNHLFSGLLACRSLYSQPADLGAVLVDRPVIGVRIARETRSAKRKGALEGSAT
jgi:hypothetical protein